MHWLVNQHGGSHLINNNYIARDWGWICRLCTGELGIVVNRVEQLRRGHFHWAVFWNCVTSFSEFFTYNSLHLFSSDFTIYDQKINLLRRDNSMFRPLALIFVLVFNCQVIVQWIPGYTCDGRLISLYPVLTLAMADLWLVI